MLVKRCPVSCLGLVITYALLQAANPECQFIPRLIQDENWRTLFVFIGLSEAARLYDVETMRRLNTHGELSSEITKWLAGASVEPVIVNQKSLCGEAMQDRFAIISAEDFQRIETLWAVAA